jgi:hypothetical protein
VYRLQPKDTRDASPARLILLAIFVILVAFSCGGYGIQIWQRSGPAMASVTLLGATALLLGSVAMIVIGIRGLRANRISRTGRE